MRFRLSAVLAVELWALTVLSIPRHVVVTAPRSAAQPPIDRPSLAALNAREAWPRTPAPALGGGRLPDDPAAVETPPVPAGATVAGIATWLCNADPSRGPVSRCTAGHPDGPGRDLYAAAGPALRRALGPGWRGATVAACALKRCVTVELIDSNPERDGSLIDLYGDAFEELAPLSKGRIRVTVILGPPATDTP